MWPNHDETIELLNGAQQGDRDAVDRLLDRHRDSLNRMVRCRLNQGVRAALMPAISCKTLSLRPANDWPTIYSRQPFHSMLGCGSWPAIDWQTHIAASSLLSATLPANKPSLIRTNPLSTRWPCARRAIDAGCRVAEKRVCATFPVGGEPIGR